LYGHIQIYVGGVNADWPVPEEGDEDEEDMLGLEDEDDDEVDEDERIARLLTGKRGAGRKGKKGGAATRGADPFEFQGEGRVSNHVSRAGVAGSCSFSQVA
jgi:hypothetical protein